MAKATRTTNYTVLKLDGGKWSMVGNTDANSSEKAVENIARTLTPPGGNYVAVPSRSFQVVPVAVEIVQPKLVIGKPKQETATEPSPIKEAAREMRDQLREPVGVQGGSETA